MGCNVESMTYFAEFSENRCSRIRGVTKSLNEYHANDQTFWTLVTEHVDDEWQEITDDARQYKPVYQTVNSPELYV